MAQKNRIPNVGTIEDEDIILEELEEDTEDSVDPSESDIENKYNTNQAQIFIQRNDFLIPNLLQMIENKEVLDISPPYQRRARWNDKKRSHLIESLLMNVPIPPVFLYEVDLAKYEVMDGQQRIQTIKLFFKSKFKLKNLRRWSELNGYTYDDLPPRIQQGLLRRGLAAVIILTESSQDNEKSIELRQYVFERLNTGGERLNPQEVRNCIYASPFNDMLHRISRSDLFTKIWDIPSRESREPQHVSPKLMNNKLYSKMADCEIVLRFFALSELDKFKGGLKLTLDNCMQRKMKLTKIQCKTLENKYMKTLALAWDIFGDKLFKLPGKDGNLFGRKSIPYADAALIALAGMMNDSDKLVESKGKVLTKTKKALSREKTYEVIVGRGNTKNAIEKRIEEMELIFRFVLA